MSEHIQSEPIEPAVPPGLGVPSDFVKLSEPVLAWIDRKLGYFGNDRFVLFYYEPRGEEVVWKDGRSYGFGTGAWCAFHEQIAPLFNRYAADLGKCEAPDDHALVIDRQTRRAYFAQRQKAEEFLSTLKPQGN